MWEILIVVHIYECIEFTNNDNKQTACIASNLTLKCFTTKFLLTCQDFFYDGLYPPHIKYASSVYFIKMSYTVTFAYTDITCFQEVLILVVSLPLTPSGRVVGCEETFSIAGSSLLTR